MVESLCEDLAALSDLDEKSLLESLTRRFNQDRIYVSEQTGLKFHVNSAVSPTFEKCNCCLSPLEKQTFSYSATIVKC